MIALPRAISNSNRRTASNNSNYTCFACSINANLKCAMNDTSHLLGLTLALLQVMLWDGAMRHIVQRPLQLPVVKSDSLQVLDVIIETQSYAQPRY